MFLGYKVNEQYILVNAPCSGRTEDHEDFRPNSKAPTEALLAAEARGEISRYLVQGEWMWVVESMYRKTEIIDADVKNQLVDARAFGLESMFNAFKKDIIRMAERPDEIEEGETLEELNERYVRIKKFVADFDDIPTRAAVEETTEDEDKGTND